MGVKLCSLASGSSGNCIYVGSESEGILIDCGVSGKEILGNLKDIGVCTSTIKGILVTHEHSDHIRSIGILSRKLDVPIYANDKTWSSFADGIGKVKAENIKTFRTGEEFEIGSIGIRPFNIPHDAVEPVGYCFYINGKKISLATDLGFFSDEVKENIKTSDLVLLESNHDVEMVKVCQYPYFLKRRILGNHGHLSNESAGEAVYELLNTGVTDVLLGHLSKENNFPELAYETVKGVLEKKLVKVGEDIKISVAPRSGVSKCYNLK